ncbi:lysine-specific demethylase 2A-like isoform X2 [Mytilus trossulus]|uniref:lysine-specific demethylase 2A-like isoform X2 n=1 Tax=Mytilus trossulus TaxID=6551 RepID=UPI003003CFD1
MNDQSDECRILRVKEKKIYSEEGIDDDEIEGKRTYSVEEKLKSTKYNKEFVKILKGEDFTVKYLQEHGLETPIVFHEKSGLGLRVPSENFKVSDVKQCVGSRRMLDVMDVNTQKGIEMSMRDWVQYYENTERSRLLNVISLEFSHTKLENYVESPALVRQVDWVDTVWPRHYKDCQTESTNIIDKMKYPKVQKYCLMSVKGCYTDFHVDFGGTSVWYHILHGKKVFWLIPPTPKNMEIYLTWVLSGKQGDIFLADKVEGCERITLHAGYTFIIPSGWIHGVYTPEDSLVFGGNFLHNYNMETQLTVSDIEDRTHVPHKFRYPFYAEIAWYVLAQYLCCLTGKQCIELPSENQEDEKTDCQDDSRPSSRCSQENGQMESKNSPEIGTSNISKSIKIELTRIDHQSVKKSPSADDEKSAIKLKQSPRKSTSDSCSSADTEIYERPDDIAGHHGDIDFSNVSKEITSKASKLKMNEDSNSSSGSIEIRRTKRERKNVHLTKWEIKGLKKMIEWLEDLPPSKKGIPKDLIDPEGVLREAKQLVIDHLQDNSQLAITGEAITYWPPSKKVIKPKKQYTSTGQKAPKAAKGKLQKSEVVRRRRTRCKKCEPCTRSDCGECNFCKDMKKFGGSGRMKQCCKSKQCLSPVLPHNATCLICNKADQPEPNQLMECSLCWEIIHVPCLHQKYENLNSEGVINEDIRQQWECPKCLHNTTKGPLQLRVKTEVKNEDPIAAPVVSIPDVKNIPKETEGKRVTVKEQMHSPISYASETDLDEVALEMECYDDAAVSPQKVTTDNQEPIKGKKDGLKKKLTAKRKITEGIKVKKSSPAMSKHRSPLKMKKSVTNVKASPLKKTIKPDDHGDVIDNPLPTLEEVQGTPEGDNPKTNGVAKTPESVKTRSGRTIKRSPTLSDENMTSDHMAKRPRREALTSPRGRRLYGFKKFRRSAGSKVRKKLSTEALDLVENVMDIDVPSTSYVEHGANHTPSKSGFRGQGQGKKRKKLIDSGPNNTNDLHKPNKLFAPGRGDITPEIIPPLKIEPLKDIKRYVIRPPPPPPPADYVIMNNGKNHPLCREIWMKIFAHLNPTSLVKSLGCCKTWNRWCMHHTLWKTINLSGKYIYQVHLIGIVKRQPSTLILKSSKLTHKQLAWLLARIPQLKTLSLSSCSWAVVSALGFAVCPLLYSLDISWITMSDEQFRDIIRPPADRHPGMVDISRLHKLKHLSVAGTEISNTSLSEIPNHLTSLEKLDISYCPRMTDDGIRQLLLPGNSVTQSLIGLDISGCTKITDRAGDSFQHCTQLQTVKMASSPHISAKIRKKCPVVSFITQSSFQIT